MGTTRPTWTLLGLGCAGLGLVLAGSTLLVLIYLLVTSPAREGAVALRMQVDAEDAMQLALEASAAELRYQLDDGGLTFGVVFLADRVIRIDGLDEKEIDGLEQIIARLPLSLNLERNGSGSVSLTPRLESLPALVTRATQQVAELGRSRVALSGLRGPKAVVEDAERGLLRLELPRPDDLDWMQRLLERRMCLELAVAEAGPARSQEELLAPFAGSIPKGYRVLPAVGRDRSEFYLVVYPSQIRGRHFKDARSGTDLFGSSSVLFTMNEEGAARLERLTRNNLGSPMAIILDGKVKSAPVVRAPIGRRGEITGDFTETEAEDLALVLRAAVEIPAATVLESRPISGEPWLRPLRHGIAACAGLLVLSFAAVVLLGVSLRRRRAASGTTAG